LDNDHDDVDEDVGIDEIMELRDDDFASSESIITKVLEPHFNEIGGFESLFYPYINDYIINKKFNANEKQDGPESTFGTEYDEIDIFSSFSTDDSLTRQNEDITRTSLPCKNNSANYLWYVIYKFVRGDKPPESTPLKRCSTFILFSEINHDKDSFHKVLEFPNKRIDYKPKNVHYNPIHGIKKYKHNLFINSTVKNHWNYRMSKALDKEMDNIIAFIYKKYHLFMTREKLIKAQQYKFNKKMKSCAKLTRQYCVNLRRHVIGIATTAKILKEILFECDPIRVVIYLIKVNIQVPGTGKSYPMCQFISTLIKFFAIKAAPNFDKCYVSNLSEFLKCQEYTANILEILLHKFMTIKYRISNDTGILGNIYSMCILPIKNFELSAKNTRRIYFYGDSSFKRFSVINVDGVGIITQTHSGVVNKPIELYDISTHPQISNAKLFSISWELRQMLLIPYCIKLMLPLTKMERIEYIDVLYKTYRQKKSSSNFYFIRTDGFGRGTLFVDNRDVGGDVKTSKMILIKRQEKIYKEDLDEVLPDVSDATITMGNVGGITNPLSAQSVVNADLKYSNILEADFIQLERLNDKRLIYNVGYGGDSNKKYKILKTMAEAFGTNLNIDECITDTDLIYNILTRDAVFVSEYDKLIDAAKYKYDVDTLHEPLLKKSKIDPFDVGVSVDIKKKKSGDDEFIHKLLIGLAD